MEDPISSSLFFNDVRPILGSHTNDWSGSICLKCIFNDSCKKKKAQSDISKGLIDSSLNFLNILSGFDHL